MTKSKIYKMAQFAVLRDEYLSEHYKLDILRVLIDAEDLALFSEKQKAKKEQEEKEKAE